ncbi:MAG: GNAT family N-acetyltransferase [Planctomycetes bacterium]|nr:GNAT family N-acetyltransferase [Planctomycetota bacterium]
MSTILDMTPADYDAVAAIDARVSGGEKRVARWKEYLTSHAVGNAVRLVARHEGKTAGYLVGETHAWEFGSEPAGWILAVGVDPAFRRLGIARALCEEAVRRFQALGVKYTRAMVRRDDFAALSFFHDGGFGHGPYVELERRLAGAPSEADEAAGTSRAVPPRLQDGG